MKKHLVNYPAYKTWNLLHFFFWNLVAWVGLVFIGCVFYTLSLLFGGWLAAIFIVSFLSTGSVVYWWMDETDRLI